MENERNGAVKTGERSLVRLAFYIVGLFMGLHLILWFCIVPFRYEPADVDTYSLNNPMTPLETVQWKGGVLAQSGPHLVVLGASSTHSVFPSDSLSSQCSGYRIQNFTVPGVNIQHTSDIIDILTKDMSVAELKKVFFVVGIFYGAFNDAIDDRYKVVDPRSGIPAFLHMPYRWIMEYFITLRSDVRALVNFRYHGDAVAASEAERKRRNEALLTKADREFWLEKVVPKKDVEVYFGKKFDVLTNMVLRAKERGVNLLLVDLPLPAWVADASPHDAAYNKKLSQLRPWLKENGVPIVDMRFMRKGELFYDWAHLKPKEAQRSCAYFARELSSFVKR